MTAKKSLGQHWLVDLAIRDEIVETAKLSQDDLVIEIGPGRGVLTEKLLEEAGEVVAVETDKELVPNLENKYSSALEEKKLKIIEADILKTTPEDLVGERSYKLVANIPYYITGAILKHFLSGEKQPEVMVLLVQKEVAERIVAKDGKESLLSISVKVYGEPKLIRVVPAEAFDPPPQVDSAILQISYISRDFFQTCSEEKFFRLIKAGFKHKRKTLKNNLELAGYHGVIDSLTEINLSPQVRAEGLNPRHWCCLVNSKTLQKTRGR